MSKRKRNQTQPDAARAHQPPAEDPKVALRTAQTRKLAAVRRLLVNEDYQAVLVPHLESARSAAVSKFLNPEISDADLRRAQARLIAVHHLANLLPDLETALTAAVENQPDPIETQLPADKEAPPVDPEIQRILASPIGGWFATLPEKIHKPSAESS